MLLAIANDRRRKIRRRIGHSEKDDDLPAGLALESATALFHVLIADWAQRCHCAMGTLEANNSSKTSAALDLTPKGSFHRPADCECDAADGERGAAILHNVFRQAGRWRLGDCLKIILGRHA
jgi:hypothetical protein